MKRKPKPVTDKSKREALEDRFIDLMIYQSLLMHRVDELREALKQERTTS